MQCIPRAATFPGEINFRAYCRCGKTSLLRDLLRILLVVSFDHTRLFSGRMDKINGPAVNSEPVYPL